MAESTEVRVWDPFVRLWHWGLAGAFALAFLTAEEAERVHVLLGYAILVMVGLRLIWGSVGTHHARFDNFVRSPRSALRYLGGLATGRAKRYLGHNPAAAFMILALLASLAATGLTGHLMTQPGATHALEEVHEAFAFLTLTLVGLHVAGVILSSLVHHENLVRAMITGNKAGAGPNDVA
jgi:cytochrome b